jgi:transcriptional regulator with XRE-family HTH domain
LATELGGFLQARRAAVKPSDVGLPWDDRHRRVPGLRRDEVAHLAGISTDYYARLEQGRMRPSSSVLAGLARALLLNEDQQTYMYGLAGQPPSRPGSRAALRAQPYMELLLAQITASPAIVATRICDVLAWNDLAAALFGDFSRVPAEERNFVRLLFTDPGVRRLYADWEHVARTSVGFLRMEAARDPDNPRLSALVGALSVRDAQFRAWWADHHVELKRRGTRRFQHPVVGDLVLNWDTLTSDADAEQLLMVYTADPGTPADRALRILASWTARPPAGAAEVEPQRRPRELS